MAMFHQSFAGRDLGGLLAPYHSRATSAATDTGVDGVLRVVDRSPNGLPYTDNLNNGYWTKRGTCTVSATFGPMSVGTKTMSLVQGLGAGANDVFRSNAIQGAASGVPVAASFRINKLAATGVLLLLNAQNSANGEWQIDLSLVGTGEQRITANHPAVTVIVAHTTVGGSAGPHFRMLSGAGGDMYIGGVQYQLGVTDPNFTEYFHNGDNSRPAFDGAGGVILEAARTNLFLRSQEFDNAAWVKTNMTVTANAVAGPDSESTADLIKPTTSNAVHAFSQPATHTAAPNTVSVYVKPYGYTRLGCREGTTSGWYAIVDVVTGVVIASSGMTVVVQALPSGFYRVSFTFTAAAVAQSMSIFIVGPAYTSGSPHAYSWAGDGVSGMYFWGAQDELGSLASSYIATTTAAVARAAFYIGPVPLTNMGLASQTREYTIVSLFSPLMGSGTQNPAGWIRLLTIGATAADRQFDLYYSPNLGAIYAGRLGQAGEVYVLTSWQARAQIQVAASWGGTNGLVLSVKVNNGVAIVNSNSGANFKAAASQPMTHAVFGGVYAAGVLTTNVLGEVHKGVQILDRAMSLEELQSLKPDIFDIPENGLLTRKPTNSLTKLLTRPMAA